MDQAAAEFSGSIARYPSITAGIGDGTDMCWTRSGVNIPPVSNPARLFEALFVNEDKTSIQQERERLRHRGSVLMRCMIRQNLWEGNSMHPIEINWTNT